MSFLKSKTIWFNVGLALIGSVNAFVPVIPPQWVSPVLLASAVIGTVLRVLTVVPLSEK